jgi:hypothetical protein
MRPYMIVVVCGIVFTLIGSVANADPIIGSGFYDDRQGVAEYVGTWAQDSGSSQFFSTATYTTTLFSNMTIDFRGDGFTMYYTKCSTCGDVVIYIDAVGPIPLDTFNGTTTYKNAFDATGLGPEDHTLFIQKIESNSEVFAFDAILIHAALPPTPQPTFDFSEISIEVTVEVTLELEPPAWVNEFTVPDGEGGEQNVAFSYQVTAGDLSQALLLSAVLITVLVLLIVTMRRAR